MIVLESKEREIRKGLDARGGYVGYFLFFFFLSILISDLSTGERMSGKWGGSPFSRGPNGNEKYEYVPVKKDDEFNMPLMVAAKRGPTTLSSHHRLHTLAPNLSNRCQIMKYFFCYTL